MAVIDYTITQFPDLDPHVIMVTWTGLTNGDSGRPIEFVGHVDRTLHIGGTFDTSTIVWEGSNDGTNYITTEDADGAALSFTAAGIKIVREMPRYQRPRCSAGGGSTSLQARIIIRRNRP